MIYSHDFYIKNASGPTLLLLITCTRVRVDFRETISVSETSWVNRKMFLSVKQDMTGNYKLVFVIARKIQRPVIKRR